MWSESFTVPVGNDSLAELVSAGNYAAVADVYRQPLVLLQPKVGDVLADCVAMYTFTLTRSLWLRDIQLELERVGRRGATARELVHFGAVLPEASAVGSVLALGSCRRIGGFRGFAMISGATHGGYFAGRGAACWFHRGVKILALAKSASLLT